MPTFLQLAKKIKRPQRYKKIRVKRLTSCPQKRGVCHKLFIMTPRKPNSAKRRVAKIKLSTKKFVFGYIPGEGNNLQKYSQVLIRGGLIRDLPGVHYTIIRGKLDLHGLLYRRQGRSKYGTKIWWKPKKKDRMGAMSVFKTNIREKINFRLFQKKTWRSFRILQEACQYLKIRLFSKAPDGSKRYIRAKKLADGTKKYYYEKKKVQTVLKKNFSTVSKILVINENFYEKYLFFVFFFFKCFFGNKTQNFLFKNLMKNKLFLNLMLQFLYVNIDNNLVIISFLKKNFFFFTNLKRYYQYHKVNTLFFSRFIERFTQRFITQGKKAKTEKLIYNFSEQFKKISKIPLIYFLSLVLQKIKINIELLPFRQAGRVFYVPVIVFFLRQLTITLRLLRKTINDQNELSFFTQFYTEIISIIFSQKATSKTFQKINKHNELAFSSQTNLHFRWQNKK